MFGSKARRIEELERELGLTNDLMAKFRDHATRIRKVLDIDEATSILDTIQYLVNTVHEQETLLTGAAQVLEGPKVVKKKTRKTVKKTIRRKKT